MKFVEAIQKKINPPGTSCDKDIAMAVLMRDPDNFASLLNATEKHLTWVRNQNWNMMSVIQRSRKPACSLPGTMQKR